MEGAQYAALARPPLSLVRGPTVTSDLFACAAAIDAPVIDRRKQTFLKQFDFFPPDWSHGVALSRPADDLLHHPLGAGGGGGSLFGAQRTKSRGDCLQFDSHCHLLLPLLVNSHPGTDQPSVWPSTEERNHLVPDLLLGVDQAALISPSCTHTHTHTHTPQVPYF